MSKPFKLNSAFKPSGDQPEAIRRLEEGLEDGLAHQTLLGRRGVRPPELLPGRTGDDLPGYAQNDAGNMDGRNK